MIITKEQAQFIADLAGQIQEKYGIVIGYSNPSFPSLGFQDADYVIYENPDLDDLHCFYKDDIETKALGPYMVRVLPAEPEHDEKVEELLSRINEDMLNGKIWFDPGVTREVDGLKVSVTKKTFPGMRDVFETNIFTEKYGVVYTYEHIVEAAAHDQRFQIAKEIIDDLWPRPEREIVSKDSNVEPPVDDVNDILSRILKLFGF